MDNVLWISEIGSTARALIDQNKEKNWQIHSVFNNACNLTVSDKGMITVLQPGSVLSPIGIKLKHCLKDMNEFFQPQYGIKIGDNSFHKDTSININIQQAATINCRYVYDKNIKVLPDIVFKTICNVADRYPGYQVNNEDWIETSFITKCSVTVEKLKKAVEQKDISSFFEAARSIVGLGIGLTPTGDDILAGYIPVIRFNPEYREMIEGAIPELTSLFWHSTTRISAELLACMLDYSYSVIMIQLLDSIANEDVNSCADAVQRLLHIGSSTGHDTLTGVLAALDLFR